MDHSTHSSEIAQKKAKVWVEGNLAQVKNGSRPLAGGGQERGAGSQDTGAATRRRRRFVPLAPHPVGGRDRKWRWAAHASQPIASPLVPTIPPTRPPPLDPLCPRSNLNDGGNYGGGEFNKRKKTPKMGQRREVGGSRFDYRELMKREGGWYLSK